MDGLYHLYTVQKPGFAITLRQYVSHEFLDAGMAFHSMLYRMSQDIGPDVWQQMAQHLGWQRWVSCFQDIRDYDNYWIALENLTRGDLWSLAVPANEIHWCSLEAQCENYLPVEKWFCSYPEVIRRHDQTPQALIVFPIKPAWLVSVQPAKEVFERAELWNEKLEASTFDDGVDDELDNPFSPPKSHAVSAA